MNWLKTIFKIANPKDKIIKYNIKDNILINFINKYESLVPWGKIKSIEDLQNFIRIELLGLLYGKINPENPSNNFLKDIDIEREYKQNPNDPQIQAAYQLYQQDPEKGKNFLLSTINKNKSEGFNSWWKYLTEENDIYKANPAFSYQVLKPIIDSSGAKVKAGVPSLNANSVAGIYEGLNKSIFSGNILKEYNKQLASDNIRSSEYVATGSGSGWIRIPSKNNDPEHFEENCDKLKNFSIPNKWCTGSGMAKPYLSQGDFWLYLENGMAKVAIRFIGDKVSEIRGFNNQQDYKYRREIISFVTKNNFDVSSNDQYQDYVRALQVNDYIKKSEDPIGEIENLFIGNDYDDSMNQLYLLDEELLSPEVKDQIIKPKLEKVMNGYHIIKDYNELLKYFTKEELLEKLNFLFDVRASHLSERIDLSDHVVSSGNKEIYNDPRIKKQIHNTIEKSFKNKNLQQNYLLFHYMDNPNSELLKYVKVNFPNLNKKIEEIISNDVNKFFEHTNFEKVINKINDSPEYIKNAVKNMNFRTLSEYFRMYYNEENQTENNPYRTKDDNLSKHINSEYLLEVIKNKLFSDTKVLSKELSPNYMRSDILKNLVKSYMYQYPGSNFEFLKNCYSRSNNEKICKQLFQEWFTYFKEKDPKAMSDYNIGLANYMHLINSDEENELILNKLSNEVNKNDTPYDQGMNYLPLKLFSNKEFVDKYMVNNFGKVMGSEGHQLYFEEIEKNFGIEYLYDWAIKSSLKILNSKNIEYDFPYIVKIFPKILHDPRIQHAIYNKLSMGSLPLEPRYLKPEEFSIFKNIYKKYILEKGSIPTMYEIGKMTGLDLLKDPDIQKILSNYNLIKIPSYSSI